MLLLLNKAQDLLENTTRQFDFIAPLLLRLYLAPVFYMAGMQKINHFDSTVEWFGNSDWGLDLPLPGVLAFLAAITELGGAFLLVAGLAVRWISVPLSITMFVAIFSVHIQNGWLAIATSTGIFATDRTIAAVERLDRAKSLLREHGHYEWLTEHGSFAVLNNGIEFAATYLVMLIALLYLGAGRLFSLDYWIHRRFRQ
jgi:putative oxidoreductase